MNTDNQIVAMNLESNPGANIAEQNLGSCKVSMKKLQHSTSQFRPRVQLSGRGQNKDKDKNGKSKDGSHYFGTLPHTCNYPG